MYYNNYQISIIHPTTDETVDARVTFDYTSPHSGGYDEPPDFGGVEIIEVVVYGEDIIKDFSPAQLEALEDEIFAAECEGSYYEPDDDDYDYPENYQGEF